jgi:hypothetical protein
MQGKADLLSKNTDNRLLSRNNVHLHSGCGGNRVGKRTYRRHLSAGWNDANDVAYGELLRDRRLL